MSRRKRRLSRRVSVSSTCQVMPPTVTGVTITGRRSRWPPESVTQRSSATCASQKISGRLRRCRGCTPKRTQRLPARSIGSSAKACSAEVRAPVSILALIRVMPSSGSAAHSRQPTGSLCGICGSRMPEAGGGAGCHNITAAPCGAGSRNEHIRCGDRRGVQRSRAGALRFRRWPSFRRGSVRCLLE